MPAKLGYALIAIGTLVAFGGAIQVLINITATTQVLLWGGLTILGLFVLGRGLMSVMSGHEEGEAANPEDAVGKSDQRFGRR